MDNHGYESETDLPSVNTLQTPVTTSQNPSIPSTQPDPLHIQSSLDDQKSKESESISKQTDTFDPLTSRLKPQEKQANLEQKKLPRDVVLPSKRASGSLSCLSRQKSDEPLTMRTQPEVRSSLQYVSTSKYLEKDNRRRAASERNKTNRDPGTVFTIEENLSSQYPTLPNNTPTRLLTTSTSSKVCRLCQCCSEDYIEKTNQDSKPLTDDEATSEDLSWRRLHVSRAKLKTTANTSQLLAGFTMMSFVELQINSPTNAPNWLFVVFSLCTTVLVSVLIFALMISTYLLPNIDAVSKLHVRGLVSESPHESMRGFIELAWAFSTLLGLFLFLVEVALMSWVKFWDSSFAAAWASTVIVIPFLIVFVVFAVYFYHHLVVYKVKSSASDLQHLEQLKLKLDSATKSIITTTT